MPELVSILIPAYNAEQWIGATIRSAIHQTWPKKEIIVVDDGSSDGTYDIAKCFDSRTVKVIRQANAGACSARNTALSFAQGDYIQWLDSDDLLHPEKLARQLNRAGSGHNSRVLLTCAWGAFFFDPKRAKMVPNSLWQDLAPSDWIIRKFMDRVWMNPTVWLVSRRLTELAGTWDLRLARSGDDDGEYMCRLVAASEKVQFVREATCYYRNGVVGSLSWRMGESPDRLESLWLAITLSFHHLRAIEDSNRTRAACLQYLQSSMWHFYQEDQSFLERFYSLANELGGTLQPPSISWKYYPIQQVFGWSAANSAMRNWRRTKAIAFKEVDRLLYNINTKRADH
jgi:glycosyltransferase involved in cell wall biosynthesis